MVFYEDDKIFLNVNHIHDKFINLNGSIKNFEFYNKCIIKAPMSIDKHSSYTGCSLPFPCEEIALDNTLNYYEVTKDTHGLFNIDFIYPNSFYASDGFTLYKSPIIFLLDDEKIIIELKNMCPLKTLTSRISNPFQYNMKEYLLPVATSEKTMYNYANLKLTKNLA
jgi:hypothetical protein